MAGEHLAAQQTNRPDRAGRPVAPARRILPIEEIYRLYPGEWVAVRVTSLTTQHAISHGEVLAHSPARGDISPAILRAHRQDPTVRTSVFRGGAIAFSLEELSRLIDEAEACHPDA